MLSRQNTETLHAIPRIDDRHPRFVVVTSVACHESKAVVNGCRRDYQVRLRKRMPHLPAFLNQKPPPEHNVFGNLENPFAKHGPNLICEPLIEIGAPIGLTDQLNAETNFGEGYSADVKLIERTTGNESHNPLFRLGPPQLREDIRIEQPRNQNPASRTGIRSRRGSSPISLNGEACIASTNSAPRIRPCDSDLEYAAFPAIGSPSPPSGDALGPSPPLRAAPPMPSGAGRRRAAGDPHRGRDARHPARQGTGRVR
jgi:hypothetical protein